MFPKSTLDNRFLAGPTCLQGELEESKSSMHCRAFEHRRYLSPMKNRIRSPIVGALAAKTPAARKDNDPNPPKSRSLLSSPLVEHIPNKRETAGSANASSQRCRRELSLQSARAIEALAHAIEYLHDEFMLESICDSASVAGDISIRSAAASRIAAIDLLKGLNREIYMSCPLVQPLSERFWLFWKK